MFLVEQRKKCLLGRVLAERCGGAENLLVLSCYLLCRPCLVLAGSVEAYVYVQAVAIAPSLLPGSGVGCRFYLSILFWLVMASLQSV